MCWVSGMVWVVWIAGRWPTFTPVPIHGERHPCVAAVRRRDSWARSPRTRPVCRSPAHSPRGSSSLRADRCLVGLQWGQLDGCVWSPGAPGAPPQAGRAPSRPFQSEYRRTFCPSGGFRAPGAPGHTGPPGFVREEQGIWLILPVVICLSQRLSHACLSISTLYRETANGSLNQLSFI